MRRKLRGVAVLLSRRGMRMRIGKTISTKVMIPLGIFLLAAMTFPVSAAPSEAEILGWMQQASKNEEPRVDFPDIQEKLSRGDYLGAETLATAKLNKKSDGGNPQRETFLRAEALRLRAFARAGLTKGLSIDSKFSMQDSSVLDKIADQVATKMAMMHDLAESAKLGNLLAIQEVVSTYNQIDDDSLKLLAGLGIDLDEIIVVGVDVGDPVSIEAAIQGKELRYYSTDQKLFLKLLAGVDSKDSDLLRNIEAAKSPIDLADLLRKNAFVGGPIPANTSGRAGRDVLSTLYAETMFRWKLRREFALKMQTKKLEKELSIRESFAILNYGWDESGLASAYFLAPKETGLESRSLVMPSDEIARAIGAGDRVFVRCGSLTHVAVVFSVDSAHDEIVFVDALFEFWKPANNACVHEFSQVHWKYGYYHSKLKLSEVLAMLVGVVSIRSYELPPQVWQSGTLAAESKGVTQKIADRNTAGCARETNGPNRIIGSRLQDFPKRELFRLGNLGEFADRPLENGIHSKIFLPKALNHRSQIIVALHSDANGCVSAASIFLRQSVITAQIKNAEYSSAMLALFGAEAFGEDGFNSVVKDMERESGDTNRKLSGQVSAVLNGRREFIMLKSGGLNVFLGNFNSDTGVRWIRADIW